VQVYGDNVMKKTAVYRWVKRFCEGRESVTDEERSRILSVMFEKLMVAYIREILVQVYGDNAMKKTAVYRWVKRFCEGRESVTDEERSRILSVMFEKLMVAYIREMLVQVYGDNAMKKTAVYRWVKRFCEGRESVTDEERSRILSVLFEKLMVAYIREMLVQVYGDNVMKKTAVYRWVKRFCEGRESVTDEERSRILSVLFEKLTVAYIRQMLVQVYGDKHPMTFFCSPI